jgi:hypothetical protein
LTTREQAELRAHALMSVDKARRELASAIGRWQLAMTALNHAHRCLVQIDFPDADLDRTPDGALIVPGRSPPALEEDALQQLADDLVRGDDHATPL